MKTIELEMEDYINLLYKRREEFPYGIPDCVFDYAMEIIRDCGVAAEHARPDYVVDNLIVNGDYHLYDDVREGNETDEELESRLKDEVMAFVCDEEGKYVIFSL